MLMHKDFNEFLKLLNCHKVRYVIVGGYALGAYLIPRTTKDLDILIEATERNAIKLIHALKDFGFGSLGLKITDFTEPAFTIQLGYEPVRIDISTSITGVEWNEIWANKTKGFFGKSLMPVYYIGIQQFIKNKKEVGRPMDLIDVNQLEKIVKNKAQRIRKK